MTHRFPIKEIARQAGLSLATVDRVLNNRPHVSPQTHSRVHAAVDELVSQESQLSARGRRLFVDVVAEAPRRFSQQIRSAIESVLPDIQEAVYRPRFHFQEIISESEMAGLLARIRKRGSHGVFLKARDVPVVHDMVNQLESSGIPVITLVTDIRDSRRIAYAGIDNSVAGKTAAYLMASVLASEQGTILSSRSQDEFQGETERYHEFKKLFLALRPGFNILEVSGGAGLSEETRRRLNEKLTGIATVDAVYSMGGGNHAIIEALDANGISPKHFIAHDLDSDNIGLIRDGKISFVLHHDLKLDMYQAFRALSAHHGLLLQADQYLFSDLQVITPYNLLA